LLLHRLEHAVYRLAQVQSRKTERHEAWGDVLLKQVTKFPRAPRIDVRTKRGGKRSGGSQRPRRGARGTS
jgi:hypothetical protein